MENEKKKTDVVQTSIKQKCNYCGSQEFKTVTFANGKKSKIKLHKKDCVFLKALKDNAL